MHDSNYPWKQDGGRDDSPSFQSIGLTLVQGEPVFVISSMHGNAARYQHYIDPKKQTTAAAEARTLILQLLQEVLR